MTKLRVGDIELNSGAPVHQAHSHPAGRATPLGDVPFRPKTLLLSGGSAFLAGLIWVSIAWPPALSPVGILGSGLPLLALGATVLAAGLLKSWLSRSGTSARAGARSVSTSVLRNRVSRLWPVLVRAESGQSIEELVSKSGLAEPAVVQTLVALAEEGRVRETFDAESARYCYAPVSGEIGDPRFLSLAERSRALAPPEDE